MKDNFKNEFCEYQYTVHEYFMKIYDLAINRFSYENVPDGMDIRYLEKTLTSTGACVLFKNDGSGPFTDSRFKYLCLPLAGGYNLDNYGELYNRQATAIGHTYTGLDPYNSVIIYNNRIRTPDIGMIRWYSERMYNATQNADTNIEMQKFSVIAKARDKARLSFLNAIKKWSLGTPFIFSTADGINIKDFETLDFKIPYVADKCFDYQSKLWEECLTKLGIDTIHDKKERLLQSEVEKQSSVNDIYKMSYLNERQTGIDKFNKIFGTDWKVGWHNGILYDNFKETIANSVF